MTMAAGDITVAVVSFLRFITAKVQADLMFNCLHLFLTNYGVTVTEFSR